MSNYKVCLIFSLLCLSPADHALRVASQVADIALAAWGRKDIVLSENEMPGGYIYFIVL